MVNLSHLIYLDLSGTAVGRHLHVIRSMMTMSRLGILKLRNVGLTNTDIFLLSFPSLWSLDVSENNLNDECVGTLLSFPCPEPLPPDYYEKRSHGRPAELDDSLSVVLEMAASSSIKSCYRKTGLTHLHIGGNPVTCKGVLKLVSSAQLAVLDVDDMLAPWQHIDQLEAYVNLVKQFDGITAPGRSLQYLRLPHGLVTGPDIPDIVAAAFRVEDQASRFQEIHLTIAETLDKSPFHAISLPTIALTQIPDRVWKYNWIARRLRWLINSFRSPREVVPGKGGLRVILEFQSIDPEVQNDVVFSFDDWYTSLDEIFGGDPQGTEELAGPWEGDLPAIIWRYLASISYVNRSATLVQWPVDGYPELEN